MTDIHVGITGLRRTGKTVLLTALIHQLRTLGSENLPVFEQNDQWLTAATLKPNRAGTERFPYERHLAGLRRSPPSWPAATTTESEITVETVLSRGRTANRLTALGDVVRRAIHRRGAVQRIRLHFHDYPGEYLRDAAIAQQTFSRWCDSTLAAMRQTGLPVVGDYEARIRSITATDVAVASQEARQAYADYIRAAWAIGLESISPAISLLDPNQDVRQLSSEQLALSQWLPFVPVSPQSPAWLVLQPVFQIAYQQYRTERVLPFVRRLRRSTVQLVLVDVLRALRQGPIAYNDLQQTLRQILQAYAYSSLWPRSGIRRVVFAATKADQALQSQRGHLTQLLKKAVFQAQSAITASTPATEFLYFSALRATRDVTSLIDGQPTPALQGIVAGKGESAAKHWVPGHVPAGWPSGLPGDPPWIFEDSRFPFFDFACPAFPTTDGATWDHFRLDEILFALMKDCFPSH